MTLRWVLSKKKILYIVLFGHVTNDIIWEKFEQIWPWVMEIILLHYLAQKNMRCRYLKISIQEAHIEFNFNVLIYGVSTTRVFYET